MLHDHRTPDGVVKVVKMAGVWPEDWPACLHQARVKFEKYYNHKVSHTCINTQRYTCSEEKEVESCSSWCVGCVCHVRLPFCSSLLG